MADTKEKSKKHNNIFLYIMIAFIAFAVLYGMAYVFGPQGVLPLM